MRIPSELNSALAELSARNRDGQYAVWRKTRREGPGPARGIRAERLDDLLAFAIGGNWEDVVELTERAASIAALKSVAVYPAATPKTGKLYQSVGPEAGVGCIPGV